MEDENGQRPGGPCGEKACGDMEDLLVLYAADEIEGDSRTAVEEHLRGCAGCAAALEGERRWGQAAAANCEPSPMLLAGCRAELDQALDGFEPPRAWRGLWPGFSPGRWLALHPTLTAGLLLLLGVALGRALPRWLIRPPAGAPLSTTPSAGLSDQDLRSADVSAINWEPGNGGAPPRVEVHLTAERPLVVRGTVNDSEVRRVLLYVVQNERRFGPEERLDSVELLKSSGQNTEVRRALCVTARRDRNPGVRLKALETLRGLERDELVRQTLLDALIHDANPGVRVEAINAIRQLAEHGGLAGDAQIRRALEDRMANDPSTYIRLQSAAAVRQIRAVASDE